MITNKRIYRFANLTEYQESRSSGYTEPWLSWTDGEDKVNYNKSSAEKQKEEEERHEQELLAMPVTITVLSAGTFYYWNVNDAPKGYISYNKNGGITSTWASSNAGTPLTVAAGDVLTMTSSMKSTEQGYHTFSGSTPVFTVKGNILSLDYGTTFSGKTSYSNRFNQFAYTFVNCTGLTDASELKIFRGCQYGCHAAMFKGCTSLTGAPILTASTLYAGDNESMFYGCSSLSYIKCMATTIQSQSTTNWLYGVSPTGTFVKHPDATWSRGTSGVPNGWGIIDG